MDITQAQSLTWTNDRVRLRDLKPWEHNPRQISKRAAKRLLDSWRDYGQVQLVVVGPDNEVYDGHQRLSALKAFYGDSYEVEVRRASLALTDEERRRLVILLHAGAVGRWDWEALSSWDSNALLQWGLDEEALATWKQDVAALSELIASDVAEPSASEEDYSEERAAKLLDKWKVEPGQLWKLGEHRLLCADSTLRENVERVLQGDEPRLWIFDPPFDVDYGQFELLPSVDVVGVWHRLKGAILWMADTFRDDQWGVHSLVFTGGIRGQHNHTLPCCMHENVTVWRRKWWNDKSEAIDRQVIADCGCEKTSDGRPISWQQSVGGVLAAASIGMSWAKPVVESAILMAYVPKGAIVWDCCAGSGSSLIAAHRHGRVWRGCEAQPRWVALAIDRFHKEFGVEPELVQ